MLKLRSPYATHRNETIKQTGYMDDDVEPIDILKKKKKSNHNKNLRIFRVKLKSFVQN